jgi:hypothetical protein
VTDVVSGIERVDIPGAARVMSSHVGNRLLATGLEAFAPVAGRAPLTGHRTRFRRFEVWTMLCTEGAL